MLERVGESWESREMGSERSGIRRDGESLQMGKQHILFQKMHVLGFSARGSPEPHYADSSPSCPHTTPSREEPSSPPPPSK